MVLCQYEAFDGVGPAAMAHVVEWRVTTALLFRAVARILPPLKLPPLQGERTVTQGGCEVQDTIAFIGDQGPRMTKRRHSVPARLPKGASG